MLIRIVYIVSINFISVCSWNVLCVFPMPAISHQIYYRPIWLKLLENGHNVTVITTDPIDDKHDLLTQVNVSFVYEIYNTKHRLSEILHTPRSFQEQVDAFQMVSDDGTEQLLRDPTVRKVISTRNGYDLLIVELGLPAWFALKEKFSCPMILISSMNGNAVGFSAVGDPNHPITYPDLNAPYAGCNLNFMQRLQTLLYSMFSMYYIHWVLYPSQLLLAREYIHPEARDLYEIQREADMVFVNHIPGFHDNRPHGPSVLRLNCLHITSPNKILDTSLAKFLESANGKDGDEGDGVIYMSLGSQLRSDLLSNKTLNVFADAFSELSHKVLWKLDNNVLRSHDRIKISKWLPQQDVLRHVNVKAFITQAGLQSVEEGIVYRVPMIAIPFYGDQWQNAHRIETTGIGIKLDVQTLTALQLRDAIAEVINNPRYKSNIKKLASYNCNRPIAAVDEATWWIQRITQLKGADYLKNKTINIPWYQMYFLDVLGLVICLLIVLLSLVICIVKLCLKFTSFSARKIKIE